MGGVTGGAGFDDGVGRCGAGRADVDVPVPFTAFLRTMTTGVGVLVTFFGGIFLSSLTSLPALVHCIVQTHRVRFHPDVLFYAA